MPTMSLAVRGPSGVVMPFSAALMSLLNLFTVFFGVPALNGHLSTLFLPQISRKDCNVAALALSEPARMKVDRRPCACVHATGLMAPSRTMCS